MPIPIDPGWLHFARLAPWRFAKTYPAMLAIFGWRTIKQAVLYTRSADQKTLAGMRYPTPSVLNENICVDREILRLRGSGDAAGP